MKRVHFIGIGGYSMSGLALLLHHQGYQVTGSDMSVSSRTERLKSAGIAVHLGHDRSHVDGADMVVYNTDVPTDNLERQEAEARHIPLFHRSEILAQALSGRRAITISGTHGKTTTTTMIGTVLEQALLDPTVLVGGEVLRFNGNLRMGQSAWAVAEADESDGSFLRYDPHIAVATNVEAEHLDHFQGSFSVLVDAFRNYLSKVPGDGLAILGTDNEVLRDMSRSLSVPVRTYGLNDEADVRAVDLELKSTESLFTVISGNAPKVRARLTVPGIHNIQNALAAAAVAEHLSIPWDVFAASLTTFHNANRRFQIIRDGSIRVIDDYAHHPTEIRATLTACRQVTAGRVIALFQPQRYTRTKSLWTEFIHAFDEADELFLTDIYSPPGEKPIPGISGQAFAEAVQQVLNRPVHFVPNMFDAVAPVVSQLSSGDSFITMGAGNVYQVGQMVAERLSQNQEI